MSQSFLFSRMHTVFASALNSFDSGALLDNEGQIIDLKYETLADVGTLGHCANIISKYFPLEEGDAVIVNDPYSGGTVLSSITLITKLTLSQNSYFLVARIGFKPLLTISQRLDEEGLRIPPTPLIHKREINAAILDAIAGHPQCPTGFKERIALTSQKLFNNCDTLKKWAAAEPELFSKISLKNYFKACKERVLTLLADLPHGEARIETKLDTGEAIKLKVELSGSEAHFDFSGTSVSKRVCLTDQSTLGACAGAMMAFIKDPIPINSSFLSLIHVAAPLGCLLNSKYPSPTFKGMTEGTTIVASTVLSALHDIAPQLKTSLSAVAPAMIGFQFDPSVSFFDSIAGGTGASSAHEGVDALQFWVRNKLQNSVEEVERRYPLLIKQIAIRQGSGGKGQRRGGHGMVKEYELLAPAKMSWVLEHRKNLPTGLKGALHGQPSELFVVKKDGSKNQIEDCEGCLNLEAGDKIFLNSAGGGGYGKPL